MNESVFGPRVALQARNWGLAICVLILAGSFRLYADDDDMVSTNRVRRPIEELFKTDTVYPEERGELEVGLTSVYQHNSLGNTWTVPVTLEYGLTDNWQVEAEWNGYVQRTPKGGSTVRGIGDLELNAQYSFLNVNDSLYHIAPRFGVEVPLGNVNKGLSEGFMEYQPGVILARDIPQLHRTQVFTEIGVNFVQRVKRPTEADDAEPAAHELAVGAGFFTLFSRGALTMEFNWNNNKWNHHGTENTWYATPGVLWRVTRNVEFGVGVPIGLNRQSDRFDVVSHLVFEF
jgi:hypothetical protein